VFVFGGQGRHLLVVDGQGYLGRAIEVNPTDPGPDLTQAEIEAFEREIGGRLGDDYKSFLLARNGGFPESPVGFRWKGRIREIVSFEMLLPAEEEIGLRGGLSCLRELEINGFLPVASVDFGEGDVCVSFLDNIGEVSLAEYEHECEVPVSARLSLLARSFDEFVGSLLEIPTVYCPIEELGKHGAPSDLAAHLSEGNSIDKLGKNGFGIICEAIRFSNIPMIKACIDQSASLSKTLHQSVTLQHPGILAMLIDAGADVNEKDEFGYRPLHYFGGTDLPGEQGATQRRVQELLIESGAVE